MTYLYEALDKPTRLYIKKCSHCELKYFGKTISDDIETYQGSGIRWQNHLKKHNAESVHLWNSDWYYDTSIIRFATKFSNINKIVESIGWANIAIENGIQGGYLGEDVNEKIKKTLNDPEWKETTGKDSHKKRLETISNPKWVETVGKQKKEKLFETTNDPIWKKTVGKERNKKHSKSFRKTINDPIWKKTVGKERNKKASESLKRTLNNPEWVEENTKTCTHCGKSCKPGMYARWHGDKCKMKSGGNS